MKLKAPPGVGDPCVAGVTIAPRDGLYEVEESVGALLIECFGFARVAAAPTKPAPPPPASATAQRRPASAPLPKLSLPAWRTKPAVKNS